MYNTSGNEKVMLFHINSKSIGSIIQTEIEDEQIDRLNILRT